MCSGGGDERREAEREQERLNEQAAARQAELDRIAAQRADIAADQARRQSEMEAQSIAFSQAQAAEVLRLEEEQDTRLASLAAEDKRQRREIREETERKVAGIERAGGAVSTSLRILGQKQPMAPQAQQTPRKKKGRSAGSTSASVARGTGSIRGTNLSI